MSLMPTREDKAREDGFQQAMAFHSSATEANRQLTADRDQWKARADAAEKRVKELEETAAELETSAQTAGNTIHRLSVRIGDLERELYDLKEEVNDSNANARADRKSCMEALLKYDSMKARCLEQINEIAELMDKVREQSQSPSLEAVLEECLADGIHWMLYSDTYSDGVFPFTATVVRSSTVLRSEKASSLPSMMEKYVCDKHPDSTFARRRREGADAPEPVKTEDAAPETPIECTLREKAMHTYPTPWRLEPETMHDDPAVVAANGAIIRRIDGGDLDVELELFFIDAVNAYQPGGEKAPAPLTDEMLAVIDQVSTVVADRAIDRATVAMLKHFENVTPEPVSTPTSSNSSRSTCRKPIRSPFHEADESEAGVE